MPPLISVIVVNWNGESCLSECLDSITGQVYSPLEVIVVDNGSTDGSLQILRSYPGILLIQNETNLGFGPANNQALSRARGEMAAFVNNDTVLEPAWLENMAGAMAGRNNVGMCAGKTLSYYRKNVIDNTGHLLYWDGVNRGRGRLQEDLGQFDHVTEAFFPSGCASLFRVEMLRQIGYFDEDFYLYGDDAELGLRARLAGWECAFVPSAVAYHRYSGSSSPYHPMKFFFVERNRVWVALKYFPLELILLNPFFSLLRYIWHFAALLTGRGVSGEFAKSESSLKLFGLLIQAQVSAWKAAPRIWRKRRAFLQQHHWKRRKFYSCFLSHRLGLRELTFTA